MKSAMNIAGAKSGTEQTMDACAPAADTRFGGPQANRSHRGGGAIRMHCPHCDHLSKARSSEPLTPLCREIRYQCMNVNGDDPCGHTFVAVIEIRRTIVPSARPNPRINLPISPRRAPMTPRGPTSLAANDDAPRPGTI